MAIRSSRTAAAARSWSNGGTSAGGRSAHAIGSVMPGSAGGGRWLGRGTWRHGSAVNVAPGTGRREDRAGIGLGPGAVDLRPVTDLLGDLHRRDLRGITVRGAGPGGACRTLAQCPEDRGDLFLVERLLVHQLQDQAVEHIAVLLEDVEGLLVGVGEELLGLLVD